MIMCAAAILACVVRVCKSRGLVVPELTLKVPKCSFLQSGSELEASFYYHRVQSVRAMRRRARRWRIAATGLLFLVMILAIYYTEFKGTGGALSLNPQHHSTKPATKFRRHARKSPTATVLLSATV